MKPRPSCILVTAGRPLPYRSGRARWPLAEQAPQTGYRVGSELSPKKALSPREGVASWGRIMAQQSAEQIIALDFAEAFADAVLVYEIWSPEYPGREIRIGPRYYSIIEVCGFVDQFTDRLPERVFLKLRTYVHDHPEGILWADLAADSSYATAARCLRKMIERRTEDRKLREAWRRNLE
jgi:hypothetical protein